MANDNSGFPSGACPDSDHIAAERARLRQASQRHFAEGAQGARPPREEQATGSPTRAPKPPPPDVESDQR